MDYKHSELKDTKMIRFIVDDRYRLLRHAMLLLGILLMIFYSDWLSEFSGAYKYYRLLCVYGALITMFYINMTILVPRFFFKGRYLIYLLLLFLLVVAGLAVMTGLLSAYLDPEKIVSARHENVVYRGPYEAVIILVPIILVTTMIKLFQRWTRDNARIAELKNITLTMELNELRNQINPHFLFNMLNGIKALVRSNPEKATVVIMKLSEFLRYQLYENNEERTLLNSEIHFLSNFLNLETLRRDNLSIDISTPTESRVLNSISLPPNLFTIFVENAVKHSVNISGSESYIRVEIKINGDKLSFSCINSKDPRYCPPDKKNSGLGLANIKRRLELLYAGNYVLDIKSTETEYSINLTTPI